MPVDEIAPLSQQQLKRILDLSLNPVLQENQGHPSSCFFYSTHVVNVEHLSIEELLREANLEYFRTANKLIFDSSLRDPSQGELFAALELPEQQEEPPASELRSTLPVSLR